MISQYTSNYSVSAVVQINQNDYLGVINLAREKLKISRKVERIQIKDIIKRDTITEDNQ